MITGILEQGNDNFAQNFDSTSEFDTSNELENERPAETLIHGFTDSQRIHYLKDKFV
jgi:hypothetical protein